MSATTTVTDEDRPAASGTRHEARLLADLLRTSRVTLLFGEVGDGRSELIRRGVLPLLQRRSGDRRRGSRPPPSAAAPLAERRGPRGSARRKLVERVIVFDDWDGAPLAGLQVAILSSLPMGVVLQTHSERLAGLLAEICDRVSGRFLLILDGVDRLWSGPSSAESIQDFVDQFAEAVNLVGLRVNFLLSIDAAGEPMLEPLRQRIAGFDDATLRLRQRNTGARDDAAAGHVGPPLARTGAPLGLPAEVTTVAAPVIATPTSRVRRRRAKRVPVVPLPPMEVGGVYAFIESTLTQTAGAVQPWGDAETPAHAGPATASRPMASSSGAAAATRPVPGRAVEVVHHAAGQEIELRGAAPPAELRGGAPPAEFRGAAPPSEPPSPIDQWLDAATVWCRRLFGRD